MVVPTAWTNIFQLKRTHLYYVKYVSGKSCIAEILSLVKYKLYDLLK